KWLFSVDQNWRFSPDPEWRLSPDANNNGCFSAYTVDIFVVLWEAEAGIKDGLKGCCSELISGSDGQENE
ncbi:hypothetical protein, partial [Pseudoflavonifractor phocaeensis]|uniref:hypothetical protein n=1 Tax=Pseudoflavonifractor phocaeensis TaxID=1870988 RepID=UPI00195F081E